MTALGYVAGQDTDVSRYPETIDGLTHGWRWYRLEGNRLLSPLVGQIPLPRNGTLDNAYFIPRADQIWSMVLMIKHQKWYDFALTYGSVEGPFTRDSDMPRVGSMKSSRYQALTIFTDTSAALDESYDIPIVRTLNKSALLAAEGNATKTARPLHICFVCTGNLCRSPMAEKVFAAQIRARGLGDSGPRHQCRYGRLACGWRRGCSDEPRTPGPGLFRRAHRHPHRPRPLIRRPLGGDGPRPRPPTRGSRR
jgi:hypothetical protein